MTDLDIAENKLTRVNFHSPCMPEHKHTFFEIVLVESGTVINNINNNQSFNAEQMEVILIRTCDSHTINFGTKNSSWRDLYVNKKIFKETCNFISATLYDEIMGQELAPRCLLSLDEYTVLGRKISTLESLLLDDKNSPKAKSIFKNIICDILIKFAEYNITSNDKAPFWLTKLYKRMTYYDYVRKSIKDIVAETGFTNAYITTMFKKYYGTSLINYHNKTKVMYSINLLGKAKIIDIALALGWENPKNYSIAFRKVYNMNPKKYEKFLMAKKSRSNQKMTFMESISSNIDF